MKRSIVLALGSSFVVSMSAAAQVGYPPRQSPYKDLEHTQELTLLFGAFSPPKDAAGVAPQGGAAYGLHYEWRAGGPAHVTGELVRIQSKHQILNPTRTGTARDGGISDKPLYAADLGLGLSLTGGRSWHSIVPELKGGLGFVSNFTPQTDSGGFKFGTRFALTWGGGIRLVPGGRLQLRADVTNRLYTIAYPDAYYIPPANGTAVLPPNQAKSSWTNNPTFTLGVSYLFSR